MAELGARALNGLGGLHCAQHLIWAKQLPVRAVNTVSVLKPESEIDVRVPYG